MFICSHFNALPIEQNYVLCRFGLIFNSLWEKCVVLLYLEFTNRQPFKKNEFMNDIPEQNKHRKLNPFSI